jgi:hypothetical protein
MPDLSYRWQQSPTSGREYFASIHHYRDPAKSIAMVLEADSSGKVWPSVHAGNKQLPTKEESYQTFEDAANACCKAVIVHLRNKQMGSYIMGFLPWESGSELCRAMRTSSTAVCQWNNDKFRLGRWAVNHAAGLMGLHGYARGGGEVYKLEMPYWESPEYYADPIKPERKAKPRQPSGGKIGRPKNLKKEA